MKVLYTLDVRRLEDALLERIAAREHGGLLEGTLVLVPTSRVATHLKHRIVERVGAVLRVHVLTHRGLAVEALEHSLEVPPARLPDAALLSIVDAIVEAGALGDGGETLREFRGARIAFLATLKDLRESGIAPAEAATHLSKEKSPMATFVARAFGAYTAALERLAAQGWSDDAGTLKAAVPRVARYLELKGIRSAFHHGAYELTGASLELLHAVASAAETTFLLPSGIAGPAFENARRFAEVLRKTGATVEPLRGAEMAKPSFEIRSVQGVASELRAAALRALALNDRDGIPLEEIAIVARSLEPYAPDLEATFREIGIPFTSSATSPLAREPAVSTFLALLRVLARDFERGAVIDLLRRPRLGTEAPRDDVDAWDRWSRAARIAGGLSEWRELPRIVERLERGRADGEEDPGRDAERRESLQRSAQTLVGILDDLERERIAWQGAKTLAEHAAFLRSLAGRRIVPAEDAGENGVEHLIDVVEIACQARSTRPDDLELVASLARSVAEEEGVPIRRKDEGGVRVLGLMQARGLTHRAVIWIGFHDGLFPRRPSEDPFLPEPVRARIASATGKLLLPKLDAVHEEKLLLSMTLASASDRFALSFQRADDDGQVRARSSALRDVARHFTGNPDVNPLPVEHVPAHPGEQALHFARSCAIGLIPPASSAVAAAVSARSGAGPESARLVLRDLEQEETGAIAALDCVERLERFSPGDRAFDGWTGVPFDSARRLYPTALERLARCPQSFFLRDVLGVHELEGDAAAHRIEERALGEAAHDALAKLYSRLHADGFLAGKAGALDRALELLAPLWRAALREKAGPSFARLRGLFAVLEERWLETLREFVRRDLPAIAAAGAPEIFATEKRYESQVELGPDLKVSLAGYLDRLARFGTEVRVDDYKTGKHVDAKVEATRILTGSDLQLPLYREIVAGALGVEPDRVKARLLVVRPDTDVKKAEAALELEDAVRDGMLETIGVSWRLARKGFFPLHKEATDRSYCGYCGFRRTCRKSHQPTLQRLEGDPELADFRDVWKKKWNSRTKVAKLADVRKAGKDASPGAPEGDET